MFGWSTELHWNFKKTKQIKAKSMKKIIWLKRSVSVQKNCNADNATRPLIKDTVIE